MPVAKHQLIGAFLLMDKGAMYAIKGACLCAIQIKSPAYHRAFLKCDQTRCVC